MKTPPETPTAGPHTELDVDSIFEDYMGIDQYIKMETLPTMTSTTLTCT
ncbi:MAG: hypothetical protein IPM82_25140 [Saprospiraceae bacterium]|nr:hypothetical protein [Saprospiraceae bacterium]